MQLGDQSWREYALIAQQVIWLSQIKATTVKN